MKEYNPTSIEKKWQKYWDDNKVFKTTLDKSKKKFYGLLEFPYPSGRGLHVGHPRPYTAMDIISRKRRMQGYNVLFPMGWDAFGLPTENFAIKNKIHPKIVTENNIKRFKEQLKSIGFSFDWDREINTTDPKYYKWTQWIFLQMFKKGLAYKAEMPINWCTSCKVGLANEEVIAGKCERCGSDVIKKVKSQWMLKITEYADRLIDDLELVDYSERIKQQQINWIKRSYGMEINFNIKNSNDNITIFTTRPETIFGASHLVIAAENPIIKKYKDKIENYDEVSKYIEKVVNESEFDRTNMSKEKSGVEIKGIKVINPVNSEELSVWISDYVLMTYGTGAIMAVPAHDDRDAEFVEKYGLKSNKVIDDDGIMINSGILNGLRENEAKEKIMQYLEKEKIGIKKKNYKLRDWVFSRQRYWGEPIPIVNCDKCGYVPVEEKDLPVLLPEVEAYEPAETGESPLSKIESFVNTTCPLCGKPAKRETDTMPQWAGSSWYFLRYIDPNNDKEFANKELIDYYMPVDWYNGGMEHTTLHLLYSRFWHKFLYDLGLVNTKEPYMKRTSHGVILGTNNEKMSKSRGNVINPDDIVSEYGADTLRTYEMFIGDFEKSVPWSENGVRGCRKFLDRVWKAQSLVNNEKGYSKDLKSLMHKTIKKVSFDFESLKFNTAISTLMTLLNKFNKKGRITEDEFKTFLILLNPIAPHITEEIWECLNYDGYMYEQKWPIYKENLTKDEFLEIPVQLNGKVRTVINISANEDEEIVKQKVHSNTDILKALDNKNILKEIYVKNRIYNIVVR